MKIHARIAAASLGLAALLSQAPASAAEELKVGDKAPDFTLKATDGKTYSLADFKGKKGVVLAWFPKADTPGCTIECKSINESNAALKEMGVAFFTASVDKPEDNMKFSEKHGFAFPVLSDPTKEAAKAYGVMMAERPMANRWTFYIDKEGTIKEIDKKIKNAQAGTDIGAKIKSLGLSE